MMRRNIAANVGVGYTRSYCTYRYGMKAHEIKSPYLSPVTTGLDSY